MALTASGIGSGLDVDGLVTQLVAAERLPLERRLVKRETNLTQDISALGTFKSALADLQSSLWPLTPLPHFNRRTRRPLIPPS